MKNYLPFIALLAALSLNLPAQQPKENSSDAVEAPPASSVPSTSPIPSAGSKAKKPKSGVTSRNHVTTSEVKNFTFNRTFHSVPRPLVVRSSTVDPKTAAQLEEDLSIMSRILEKNAADYREDHEEAAGIAIVTLGGSKGVRAMYLEDYGVVFTMSVNIPLHPEPKSDRVEETTQSGANEEWNEARSEVFGDRKLWVQRDLRERRDFDQHQLDEFRNSLIESLRNAANIRNLRESDWITLVVRGRGASTEGDGTMDLLFRSSGATVGGAYNGYGGAVAPVSHEIPNRLGAGEDRASEPSTMVFRIKKSTLDELSRQKGSPEAFRQKVSAVLY